MVAEQTRYHICRFFLHEDVLEPFKEVVSRDNLSAAKAIEQFLASYVYCLDPSFVDGAEKHHEKNKKKALYIRISAEIFRAFEEKTKAEKVDMNLIVEQFMAHYTAFMRAKKPSIDGTMK